jgi:hypothetical protein
MKMQRRAYGKIQRLELGAMIAATLLYTTAALVLMVVST